MHACMHAHTHACVHTRTYTHLVKVLYVLLEYFDKTWYTYINYVGTSGLQHFEYHVSPQIPYLLG